MYFRGMTYSQKIAMHKKLAKRANARLSTLEKNQQTQWSYRHAQEYIKSSNRKKKNKNRYYTGSQFKTEKELNNELLELDRFLNFKSSTMRGIDSISKERLETFAEHGIKVADSESFFDFISSNQFKMLKNRMDSSQIISIYSDAIDSKKTKEEIEKAFQEYEDGRLRGVEDILHKLNLNRGTLLKWRN